MENIYPLYLEARSLIMSQHTETSIIPRHVWCLLIAVIFATTCLPGFIGAEERNTRTRSEWSLLITPEELSSRANDKLTLIVDVRSEEQYREGHIPGAINVPGSKWRTPASKDPKRDGPGQRIFRQEDGSVDIARYEKLLGEAGITPEHRIVVYGNHAGKADGSVPAAILLKLGHHHVAFLDGIGLDRWTAAGLPVSRDPVTLHPGRYVAASDAKSVWSAEDVLEHLENEDVVFIDSRTPAEFQGQDLRGNERGGHIPGAQLLNSDDFLNLATGTTISRAAAQEKIEKLIPRGKTVVIYCQSGTRCSHEELILRDLGYENVILYDGSWQEWGNRSDTPVEKDATVKAAPRQD